MNAPSIEFAGDRMKVFFDRFGIPEYKLFLQCKTLPEYQVEFDPALEAYTISAPARFASMLGVQRPEPDGEPLPFSPFLFDDQREVVRIALDAKRFAVWSGCGNGKTLVGLEYARHVLHRTNGRCLIVTRNEIVGQWIEEAERFYGSALPLVRLTTRKAMREWCEHGEPGLGITNYEKWNPKNLDDQIVNEARHLACVILDESSRLRGGGGKQKWAIIKSCRGIEYKLSLTATPAPNDTIEFASQASFLEKMRTDHDIIWTYFVRDPKTHRWTVKPHAREAFFRFMSSWSIYINDPKRYGWRNNVPDVPRPVYHTIDVEPTREQQEIMRELTADVVTGQMELFGSDEVNAIQRAKMSQVAKGFRYVPTEAGRRKVELIPSKKPAVVADLIRKEAGSGAQVLVWTVFDAETQILDELAADIEGVAVMTGKTDKAKRPAILDAFRRGDIRVLISRASMLGYGMNFQMCSAMIFSGFNDSFEQLYQAVRRAVRHGQKEAVRVYFPVIHTLEGDMFDNIQRKEGEFERSIAEMEKNYIAATRIMRQSFTK